LDSHPPPSGSARFSVTAPVSTALDWTGRVLFRPFDLGKWFALGFCAWLAWIGQHGGGVGANWRVPSGADGGLSRASQWVQDHLALFVVLVALALIVAIAFTLLCTWLSSRGKLMFLDGVVHDRGAVVEPWHRYREQGDSLFGFRVVVGSICLVVLGILIGSMVALLVALDFDHDPGLATILAISGFVLVLLLPVLVLMGLVGVAINDLVVPIQWVRGCRATAAWTEACGLIARHAGTFVRYALLKLLLALVIVFISCCLVCVTCCIAGLPYIGTVILLPLYVFGRSYSLHFLSQLGPDYAALASRADVPPPTSAATPGGEAPA